MEFLPGAFENEWERRRAALLHDLAAGGGKGDGFEWEWRRRGGVARLPVGERSGPGASRSSRDFSTSAIEPGGTGSVRSMRDRFRGLASGSQPAVVKLASYGGGGRAASMMSYVSRNGELAVENEIGERVLGRSELAETRADWEHLFDNRAASRDVGVFRVAIEPGSETARDLSIDETALDVLKAGFGQRGFVYAVVQENSGATRIEGVVVLRDRAGERLSADAKAASIVQERFDSSDAARVGAVRFSFHGHGNGVEYGTARVRDLVERCDGVVRDETGCPIATADEAGNLVQKEWRKELHSRKGRDVMHLIVSARAGTDGGRFTSAVRDFLGDRFAGHRYVFAVHDPAADPKETGKGGKRPHIHAHAVVTMRSETGDRIETSPKIFREWRLAMAEKAREHGIAMEMTDRRDLASAPAFTRNQVRPVSYAGRTEHEGTSPFAQARYDAKRLDTRTAARSARSRDYVVQAGHVWKDIAQRAENATEATFAKAQTELLASEESKELVGRAGADRSGARFRAADQHFGRKEDEMRQMTREEFEAYDRRVETVLQDVEKTIDAADRRDFTEVAAAARDIVNIRREHLEIREQIETIEGKREPERTATNRSHPETDRGRDPLDQDSHVIASARSEQPANAGREATELDSPVSARPSALASSGETAPVESPKNADRLDEVSDRQHRDVEEQLSEPASAEKNRTARDKAMPVIKEEHSERAAPPQQHVPRLQELEREAEMRAERERDDRDR